MRVVLVLAVCCRVHDGLMRMMGMSVQATVLVTGSRLAGLAHRLAAASSSLLVVVLVVFFEREHNRAELVERVVVYFERSFDDILAKRQLAWTARCAGSTSASIGAGHCCICIVLVATTRRVVSQSVLLLLLDSLVNELEPFLELVELVSTYVGRLVHALTFAAILARRRRRHLIGDSSFNDELAPFGRRQVLQLGQVEHFAVADHLARYDDVVYVELVELVVVEVNVLRGGATGERVAAGRRVGIRRFGAGERRRAIRAITGGRHLGRRRRRR